MTYQKIETEIPRPWNLQPSDFYINHRETIRLSVKNLHKHQTLSEAAKMAMSQAAALLEKVIGHGNNAQTEQDITNPARDRARFGHPTEV